MTAPHDVRPAGRLLDRRDAMRLLTATSLVLSSWCDLVGAATATSPTMCAVRPEATGGSFRIGDEPRRSNLRVDPASGVAEPGIPLTLAFTLARLEEGRCVPLRGASVTLSHCGLGAEGTPELRGMQVVDADGLVRFQTIYPGWARGHAVQVVVSVHAAGPEGQSYAYTSPLFFPDPLTDDVHAHTPYAASGARDTRNEDDAAFRRSGGQLLLAPTPTRDGYEASFAMAVDFSDADVSRTGRG